MFAPQLFFSETKDVYIIAYLPWCGNNAAHSDDVAMVQLAEKNSFLKHGSETLLAAFLSRLSYQNLDGIFALKQVQSKEDYIQIWLSHFHN